MNPLSRPSGTRAALQAEYDELKAQMQKLEHQLSTPEPPGMPAAQEPNTGAIPMRSPGSSPRSSNQGHTLFALIDALKADAQLQASQEESFYTLALRLRRLGDISKPLEFTSPTELNNARRRFDTEFTRLEHMAEEMERRRARVELRVLELKAVPLRQGEASLTGERDAHIGAAKDLLERIDDCITCICDLAELIVMQRNALHTPAA